MKLKDLKPGTLVKLTHPTVKVENNPWLGTIGEVIRTMRLPEGRPAIEMKILQMDPKAKGIGGREKNIGRTTTFPIDDNGWGFKVVNNDWDD